MTGAEKRAQWKSIVEAAQTSKTPVLAASSPRPQPDTEQTIRLALEHHSAGRLDEAEDLYQQALQSDPHQPAALHFLGLVAQQVGEPDIAADLMTAAVALQPDYVEAYCSLGGVLLDLNQLDNAVDNLQKAVSLRPNFVEALINLGMKPPQATRKL